MDTNDQTSNKDNIFQNFYMSKQIDISLWLQQQWINIIKRQTVIYNQQLLDMILPILLLILGALGQENILPIRAGIVKLQIDSLNQTLYTINFVKALKDQIYSSMTFFSHVQNFKPANGINMTSLCSELTQTGMRCTITLDNNNQYSTVYMSYIASDIGSLAVGTYTKSKYTNIIAFTLTNLTNLTETLKFKPDFDPEFINPRNSLFLNFYPLIAGMLLDYIGVSSADNDFSLQIQLRQNDGFSLNISLTVKFTEFHTQNVTVIFGYILYDSSIITISLYEGQGLIQGSISQGYVYGIGRIRTKPLPPKRLLQIVPLNLTKLVNPLPKDLNPSQTTNSNLHSHKSQTLTSTDTVANNKSPTKTTAITDLVDNDLFYSIFETDGFVIITSAQELDYIYFYEANSPPSTRVLFQSTVTKQQNVTCKDGETKVGKQTQIDQIQSKMVVQCISCPSDSYVDPITKNCMQRKRASSPPSETNQSGSGVLISIA